MKEMEIINNSRIMPLAPAEKVTKCLIIERQVKVLEERGKKS